MNETFYWVWLTSTLNFASGSIAKALSKFTPREAYEASEQKLTLAGLGEAEVKKLSDKSPDRAKDIISICEKKNIKIITHVMPEYPRALDRLSDKPFVLYARGDITCLSGRKTAAFIGTRKMTVRGEENAQRIAGRLIDEGSLLVSGIADGIDAVAAKVSLERGVPTVAVLGVDIDKYFPSINKNLIDEVSEHGAVVSEYPPRTNARYFATRNRIIVGLSDTVNVIEAPLGSGALIGARLALKKKIPTFALALEGRTFEGCRELISLGAKAIEGSDNIISKPTKSKPKKTTARIPDEITGMRRYIWEKLIEGEQSDNSLVDAEHPIQEILCALTELELDGYIKALPGGKYALK